MIDFKFEYPNKADFDAFIRKYQAECDKALYDSSILINRDIIKKSREQKTGRKYVRYLKGGKIKIHTSANREAGETTARMTGDQNKARDFFVSKLKAIIGVDKSVEYAVKNEMEFKDMEKGVKRNMKNVANIFAVRLEYLFNNFFNSDDKHK